MTDDSKTMDLFAPDNGDEAAPIEQHASHAYLGYAVSTVRSRALPEIADGLKPVQRRIIIIRNKRRDRRLPEELRRQIPGTGAAAGAPALRAAQRQLRHSGRLLHAHPVAQPEGGRGRGGAGHQAPALEAGGRARADAG